MTKPSFRRKPPGHGASSLLRYLFPFPQTRARARDRLYKFRHETFPSLKHHAQARVYKYIVYRQAQKLKKKTTILQRLRNRTRKLIGSNHLENEARLRRREIANGSGVAKSNKGAMTYQESYEQRESGGRRRKLAGYLKAANELRQTYTQQYAPSWRGNEENYKFEDDTPGEFPDGAVVRSGEEEMILFPSYARKHIKRKPEAQPGTIQEVGGEGRDVRDSVGAGDAEFWKKQWEDYEDDKAVVDVDVRGWIYSPFKGQMSRKQRLFIGLARQLVGVQAPPNAASEQTSSASSRDTSPGHTIMEGHMERQAQRDEQMAAREAEQILRKGEKEAAIAAKGGYSEKPYRNDDDTSLYRTTSRESVRTLDSFKPGQLSHATSRGSLKDDEHITPLQKRASWNQPSDMNAAELAEANTRLMARLRHFLAVPMANTPISVFFYNAQISKQRTIYTNAAGHFSMSAALDFVPTHVRILASEKLSATEEVIVTDSQGISVISDIDDTIKHSAISSGAREIFRNAFIRELGDLTIDGVREWYSAMAEQGVKFHYVSNSPWQLYPVISKYFALAGLPPGSFHLKQYSGMLQGIFEPVAERKKVTLDKIARDFPERNFILIGDSGEADLEVYTDFVLENPGRVVAVFIRDVTTSDRGGFFDPSVGPMPGDRTGSSSSSPHRSGSARSNAAGKLRPTSEEHDPELKAAIAASLHEIDEDDKRRSKSMFSQVEDDHPDVRPKLPGRTSDNTTPAVANLIDLSSDDEPENLPALRRVNTDTKVETQGHRMSTASTSSTKSAPPPPRKPVALRSPSSESMSSTSASSSTARPPRPPKPRQLSNSVNQPSPLSQQTSVRTPTSSVSKPPIAPKPRSTNSDEEQSYGDMARNKLWSVYNSLPALRSTDGSEAPTSEPASGRRAPPPPPPRRRDNASGALSYVGNKASSAWQHAPSVPYHSRPQVTSTQTSQPFSSSSRQGLNRTSTGSTLGGGDYGTKREILWRQRWQRAEDVMRERGVVLRSWRVGTDAMKEAERILKDAERRSKGSVGNDRAGKR
jgi:phosphatidate phosphatase APP1